MLKNRIRLISLISALAVMIVGFAWTAEIKAMHADREYTERQYAALTDSVVCLEAMAQSLRLAVADNLPLPAMIELRHNADLASAALDRVVFSGEGGRALRRFAAACAEFSAGSAEALARGEMRTPDYAVLIRLRDCAVTLVDEVLPSALVPEKNLIDEGALEAHFSTLGRLYYDGVASDVQAPSGYLFLLRGDRLNETAAREEAERILQGAYLRTADMQAEPVRYCFTAENVSLTISQIGGRLISLICDRKSSADTLINADAALAAAEQAMRDYAPVEMESVEMREDEDGFYFTFAPRQGELLCLSEQITVGIDARTGKMSVWDADRFYRYHAELRTLPEHILTVDEVMARFDFGSAETAILCTAVRNDGRELFCYRIGEGEEMLYLNAVTGRLEPIV